MPTPELFTGRLVRLTAPQPAADAEPMARWWREAEFARLIDSAPAQPLAARTVREELEEAPRPGGYPFMIRTLAEGRLVGFIGLWLTAERNRDGWVGIGIGDRADWGQGYGTDAMRVLLGYAFRELDLSRVTLGTFAYNRRAIRSYEKNGFRVEGQLRQSLHRGGRRYDEVVMGVLRREWEAQP